MIGFKKKRFDLVGFGRIYLDFREFEVALI